MAPESGDREAPPRGAAHTRRRRPHIVGGAAALVLVVLFLIGALDLVAALTRAVARAPATGGLLASLQGNWLVVLFRLNIATSGIQSGSLTVLNPLDLAIMILFAIMALSLYPTLGQTSRLWALVAAILPILGIPLFLATGTAGRSALLISGFILSILMLISHRFAWGAALIGIISSVLLFLGGDIATAIFHHSSAIAAVIGIAYLLWIGWLLLVALSLFRLPRSEDLPGFWP
jgi:hypothetical protein